MWAVIIIDTYYPSLYHFETEEEARKCFEKHKEDFNVHLAKVEETMIHEDELSSIKKNDILSYDVDWYALGR